MVFAEKLHHNPTQHQNYIQHTKVQFVLKHFYISISSYEHHTSPLSLQEQAHHVSFWIQALLALTE